MKNLLHHDAHEFDVCVVGGGMAGLCAALASARNGAKTALVQDRPVLGGNASSEVRMWICGAHGPHNKETGLLEEIQLENQYRNPTANYAMWDGVLWEKARFQPGLTLFLNNTCTDAETDGARIVSVKTWELTSQTWRTISARYFLDCSGDSILAAVAGAEFRQGREARDEFDEDIQPPTADRKTMGNTLLVQTRRTEESQPFTAPRWAYRFETEADLKHRVNGVSAHNFWWLELGGLRDTIRDAESIRDDLMKIAYGAWDYIKNRSPKRAQADCWALEWVGSLPGKRENRRLMGDHILTQNDVRAGGEFADIVAYGGWSMDDHHPGGLLYPGEPTIFHAAPSPYGIPYRCLYSRNVENLFFAGRNISVTHAALSSTRVMGTTAILGQAAGTAAALCVRHGCAPRSLSSGERLAELQRTLMEDDCWLPGVLRPVSALASSGKLAADGHGGERLLDGWDRDRADAEHAWQGAPGDGVTLRWDTPQAVGGVRLVFDSNLQLHKRMPCSYPHREPGKCAVPGSLAKAFRIEAERAGGQVETVFRETNNYQRVVTVPLEGLEARTVRLVVEETWAGVDARVFAFEPMRTVQAKMPTVAEGLPFSVVRAQTNPEDLAPPAAEVDKTARKAANPA